MPADSWLRATGAILLRIGIMHAILKQINKLVTQVTKKIIFVDGYLKFIKMLILFLFAVPNIQKTKK